MPPTPQPPRIVGPRWAERLLEWACPPCRLEEVQGDLDELFRKRVEAVGESKARRQYARDVLLFLRPFSSHHTTEVSTNPPFNAMFRNHLKVALRNAWRNRRYTAINVFGLAVGVSCCLLIGLYVLDETRYDRFWPGGERVFRINQTNVFEEEQTAASVAVRVGPAVAQGVTGVEAVTRWHLRPGSVRAEGLGGEVPKLFQENSVVLVDSAVFRVFPMQLRSGDPRRALAVPGSVVLSQSTARKYFGNANPMGRRLRYENAADLTVTGVFPDLPRSTDLRADFLVHFETLFAVESPNAADFLRKDWLFNPTQTFVRLYPETRPAQVEPGLNALIRRSGDERVAKHVRLGLQPLHEVHLHSAELESSSNTGNAGYVNLLAAIAGFTLLIACFNFINLTTAYSLRRAKEVGMRKTLGALRSQVAAQFWGEALLQCGVGLLLALVLAAVLLPGLNNLAEKSFRLLDLFQLALWPVWLGLFGLTGLLAGAYPAVFASGFRPVLALRGSVGGRAKGPKRLREVLVVAQFGLSLLLMVAAVVVYQQLSYLRNKPLGFQKEQVVVVPLFGSGASGVLPQGIDVAMRTRMNSFEQALAQHSRVRGSTALSGTPGRGYVRALVVPEGRTEQSNVFASWVSVDYDFLPTLGISLVAGRNFSKQTGTDHLEAFILNESAAREFGYANPAAAIGRPIQRGGDGGKKGRIIGVVKDFYFNPLDQPMQPLIVDIEVPRFTVFAVSIAPDGVPETLAQLESQWKAFFPERVFEYSFLDETLDAQYRSQERLGQLLGIFAGLAVLISCLGLFGLAAYMTYQRTREIGIRKVMGADTIGLVTLLSKDFVKLVGVACLLALPLAWYVLGRWLEEYANRIPLQPAVFGAVALLALVVAILTVASQTFRAAGIDPAKTVREE